MTIPVSDKPTTLSYMDLCNGLHKDIMADENMPESVKKKILGKLEKIEEEIWPYSE